MTETLEEKVRRVTAENVEITDYNPSWPELYEEERSHLLQCLPDGLIINIEHFGSTSVPGLAAKPIIDMIVEVSDVEQAKVVVPEILEPLGYDCFWRPTSGDDIPPWYTWAIKRDENGQRTHHLHFGEKGFKSETLIFRDVLRQNPDLAQKYGNLKRELSTRFANDRIAYTRAKGDFIRKATSQT